MAGSGGLIASLAPNLSMFTVADPQRTSERSLADDVTMFQRVSGAFCPCRRAAMAGVLGPVQ